MSRGWAKASTCRLQVTLSCAVLCQIVSLQYLSRSSLHRLAGLPCRLVLSLWSPSGNTRGPSVVFEAVDMPCPRPFHFSQIADYVYDYIVYCKTTIDCVCCRSHGKFTALSDYTIHLIIHWIICLFPWGIHVVF